MRLHALVSITLLTVAGGAAGSAAGGTTVAVTGKSGTINFKDTTDALLTRLAESADADPRLLEAAEERLFALRAAARKHNVLVADLPAHAESLRNRLAALETGTAEIDTLTLKANAARAAFVAETGKSSS